MNNKVLECYACCEPATSKEHVPPLCLFPEIKDIDFANFRKHLITVPSCELHNSKKSKDDEFLMITLASIFGINGIGILHLATKVSRAIKRKGLENFHEILNKTTDQKPIDENETLPEINIGYPDHVRFVNCFRHIAYGLYYHKFKETFDGEVIILIDFIKYHDNNFNKWKTVCRDQFELELKNIPIEGSNPEVFNYVFTTPDNFGLVSVKMTFYVGAIIFAIFKARGITLPKNVSWELINAGVKTVIKNEDGTSFEFN
ncbi:MAG: hypothetical protein WBP33_14050 [Saprospiraceae bacterium]